MTDLALFWDEDAWRADIAIANGDLASDDGLRTAVILSLFTDAPARADDPLPAPGDYRGWWGDALAETPGDILGSRLWLLRREKQLASVLGRARDYASEALQWLVTGKIAASIDVVVTVPAPATLLIQPSIVRPTGPGRQVYDLLWSATA